MTANVPRHVFLVDGSGYIFRAFHALPSMTRLDGTPVNAVYGFTTMLMRLVEDTDADRIAIVFDVARTTFRNSIYADYKANRPAPPPELVPQFALIRDAVKALNLRAAELPGYEADDIIATYARRAAALGAVVTIVSSDKDLMQLVDERISLFDPVKQRRIGVAQVVERFGVEPEKVVDVQALAGDSSDNVPGVPGIGVKTAAQLISEYGDLDTLLARAEEIHQPKRRSNLIEFAEQARISRELVLLRDDAPVVENLDVFTVPGLDLDRLRPFLKEQNFVSILARLGSDEENEQSAAPVEADYTLVTDGETLRQWVEAGFEAGIVAIDTETDSLNAQRARLVGLSLAVAPGKACYIPVGHNLAAELLEAEAPHQLPLETVLAILKPLLASDAVLKVGQNIKYDIKVLAGLGIHVSPIDDTMVLSYVLNGSSHGHGMDELARRYLGHECISYESVCGKGKTATTFDKVALDRARDYAAEDADITLRLHGVLRPRLREEHMTAVYETIERPLIPVLAGMENAGIKVDVAALKALSNDFARRISELEQGINDLAGRPFNIGSPKQLGEILFDEMGLPGGRKGKTGAYGTGAEILEDLRAQGHDLPARVLDWRQLSKLRSTYTEALAAAAYPRTQRVHTSFSQAVTGTGRLSSNDPNLQNIPVRTEEGRKIRRAFIAEPGHMLISADYSQIELRLLAHVAEIEPLRDAFHAGLDIHALTASQVFGQPVENMDPMTRRRAKAINFGIIYGISAFGLSRQLAIPQGEARAYIDAYFERYPGIRSYMDRAQTFARKNGYVPTIFGRKCRTPYIADKNPARRSFAERAAINAPLQGSAADIIKRAMLRVPPALVRAGLKARMILQVHDELLFEAPEDEVEETCVCVAAVMESAAALAIPLVVETGVADNWADSH
ncbi:MAG: DNA polymerase I [Alphaproteobacteria bacterium]|nr:DNA polymerase I [Alphaproteobacteria bacterium]